MEFKNEAKSTRSGFSYTSSLYKDGELIATAKCNYLNRTWESYAFESSMKQAVSIAINSEVLAEKDKRGIKRLTKTLKEEILNSPQIVELVEFRKTL